MFNYDIHKILCQNIYPWTIIFKEFVKERYLNFIAQYFTQDYYYVQYSIGNIMKTKK